MKYVLREYRAALIFYIIFGGLISWFNPFNAPGGFLINWIGTVIGASLFFFAWVFIRAAWLSYKKRKNS